MNHKLISFAVVFLLLLNLSSAFVSFYQTRELSLVNPHQTRISNSVFWYEGQFEGVKDAITSDNLLEVEIDFSMYPQSWNTANPNFTIENCTLTMNYFESKLNNSYILYTTTTTKNDIDIFGDKYFVRLPQKDGISVFMDCYFTNESNRVLDTPTELSIKLPTYECKSCQYYNWLKDTRSVEKAKIVGRNAVSTWEYIRELVSLNFEIILALFWLLMILIFVGAIGIIFIAIYWVFLYLKNLSKRI